MKKTCVICHREFNACRSKYKCCSMACAKVERVRTRMAKRPDRNRQCAVCGRPFRFHPGGKSTRPSQKFCSRTCASKGQRQRQPMPKRPCLVCGKEFAPHKRTDKCCSRKCGYMHHRMQTIKRHEELGRTCAWCGKRFWARTKGQRHCGWNCAQAHRFSTTHVHNWLGGPHIPYRTGFVGIAKKIRERDGYLCRICKLPSRSNRELDVHHIDYDKTNHASKNLMALCRLCHIQTNYHREYWITRLRILANDE